MAAQALHSISYRSRAAVSVDDSYWRGLEAIATTRNAAMQISGGLVFDGRYFFQTIEGPRAAVSTLMAAIQRDPNHQQIIPFGIRPIATRFFHDWAMKFVPLESGSSSTFAQFSYLDLRNHDHIDSLNQAIRAT